jgi:hypothetical protein
MSLRLPSATAKRLATWAVPGFALGCTISIVALIALHLWGGPEVPAAPVLTVVPNPTLSPSSTPSPTPTFLSTLTPGAGLPAPGGEVAVGSLVQVVGTGTDGLRLRVAPGLQSATNLVAVENEVFEVQDGPSESDGRIWWYLVNPYDTSKYGWGVEEYLRPAGG